ncbi:peptidoglycan-binding protein [Streptomyces sp. NPDC006314]|uniref:peptidoglycan-binding protein n=1 Tax=Streptomyces sp. NPDC006314 TaxID=3154475 RepID=UPI0033A05706
MSESEGRTCPECGAPRGPDHTPSCDCTERASEALREARTAEAAAAEDFDPLRIRPYVDVEQPRPAPAAAGASADAETRPVPAVEAPRPLRAAVGPTTAGLRMFEAGGTDEPGAAEPAAERPRRRSRRVVPLAVAGAGVAVVVAAGFAGGPFSYHTPSRDRAAEEVRESVPDVTAPGPASPTAPGAPAASRPPAQAPSTSAAPSPSPSPSSSPSPSASRSPSGSASATPSPVTVSAPPGTAPATPAVAPVLRRGDFGPEVTELQQRLRGLNLYGDQIDGLFTRPVEDAVRNYQLARGVRGDEPGVYGPATRASLEAETPEP